jgi:hypothetical protein
LLARVAIAAITAAKLASDARSHKIDFSVTGAPEDTKTTLLHLDELTISGECNANNSSAALTIVGKSSVSGQLAGSIIDGSASSPSLIDYALAAGGFAPGPSPAINRIAPVSSPDRAHAPAPVRHSSRMKAGCPPTARCRGGQECGALLLRL